MRPAALLLLSAALFLAAGAAAQPPEPKKEDKKGIDRGRETRKRLLKDFGGSEEGEEAVMLGLAWLTQEQKEDGHWEFQGPAGFQTETAGATGLVVLAYLGAGQSHKDGRYKQTVQAGLDWLVKDLDDAGASKGRFRGAQDGLGRIYCQGIATLALCEAYGVTQDPALKEPAQRAVNYIQRIQAPNGSWGYEPGTPGDTSIVGWQVQALHAAQLAKLDVDARVVKKAVAFLNLAGSGKNKASYGYNDSGGATPATALTAIGLLMRYYIDGWRDTNEGFAEGTKGLLARAPVPTDPANKLDLYYYYYATQVARFHGGEAWKTWNEGAKQADGTRKGGMPEWLIATQDRTPANRGSWPVELGTDGIAQSCGRVGSTAFCLLTLEVYYRYSPEETGAKKP